MMLKTIYKTLIIVSILFTNGFAYNMNISKYFSKVKNNKISQQYGDDGIRALGTLTQKYGKNSISKLNEISMVYGNKGLRYLNKYGEIAIKNRTNFNIIDTFGSKGVYLLKQYPSKGVEYYNKFGNKFVINAQKYGNKRVIKYLDESKKFNQDSKILKFLDKFGDKANVFLDRHWGKLLASGFVLLNADSIIASTENIANKTIDKSGEIVTDSVSNIANSQLGLFIGIALLLFIFFKYGLDKIIKIRNNYKDKNV